MIVVLITKDNITGGEENDVLPDKNGIAQGMEENIIDGIDKGVFGNQ